MMFLLPFLNTYTLHCSNSQLLCNLNSFKNLNFQSIAGQDVVAGGACTTPYKELVTR